MRYFLTKLHNLGTWEGEKKFLGLPNTQPHSLDQNWSGYSDKLIVRASVLLSIAITIVNVVVEIIWKLNFGQNLIATSHTYIYMGMQVDCILRYFLIQPVLESQ